jgi:hypothetical protein
MRTPDSDRAARERPVCKRDPPVRASLRPALTSPRSPTSEHAIVDAVELVRAAHRERAVPFTNAVMRRLAQGFRGLVASLPEGPVKESYPDWIAETWVRDFGNEAALSLMRAQNEPPGLEVRADSPVGGSGRARPSRGARARHHAHAADSRASQLAAPSSSARRIRANPRRAWPGREDDDASWDRGRGASRSARQHWRRTSA